MAKDQAIQLRRERLNRDTMNAITELGLDVDDVRDVFATIVTTMEEDERDERKLSGDDV